MMIIRNIILCSALLLTGCCKKKMSTYVEARETIVKIKKYHCETNLYKYILIKTSKPNKLVISIDENGKCHIEAGQWIVKDDYDNTIITNEANKIYIDNDYQLRLKDWLK